MWNANPTCLIIKIQFLFLFEFKMKYSDNTKLSILKVIKRNLVHLFHTTFDPSFKIYFFET